MPRSLLLAVVWLLPTAALALDEGEASLAGGVGATWAGSGDRAGAAIELRLLRGITDTWAGRLGAQVTYFPAAGEQRTLVVTSQALGVTAALDVIGWVPHLDLGLVAADMRGGGSQASQYLGAQAGAGIDYLVTRHLAASAVGHVDYYAVRLAGPGEERPTLWTFAALLEYVF